MVPVEESLAFKDPADRKAESVARNMFTIAGSALRPILATALVSQTLTEWAKFLRHCLGSELFPPAYVELADHLVQGLQFVCDASLYTAPLLSKLSISAVVLGRILWLKCWSADHTSKNALTDLPFLRYPGSHH